MSLWRIRSQIKNILEDVHGIGVVYDHEKWASTWDKFINFFRNGENLINGWMITRRRTQKFILAQGGEDTRVHHFIIKGIMGLNDARDTEIIFQDLIEDIVERFDRYDTLNNTCWSCCPVNGPARLTSGIQVNVVEPRMFGSVLCHYAELFLYVQEIQR